METEKKWVLVLRDSDFHFIVVLEERKKNNAGEEIIKNIIKNNLNILFIFFWSWQSDFTLQESNVTVDHNDMVLHCQLGLGI